MSASLWGGAIELIAVVLGVLIALWLNNWNDARKERRRERAYLRSLLDDDVQADRESLARNITFCAGTAAAAASVLRIVRGEDVQPPPRNALLRRLKRAGTMYPFRPTTTTLRELSGGGGLTVFSDREVLRSLLRYHAEAEITKDFSALAIHHIWYRYYEALDEVIDPVLEPQLSLDAWAQLREGDGANVRPDSEAALPDMGVYIPEDGLRLYRLRGNTGLERALANVWNAAIVYRESMRDLRRVADRWWEDLNQVLADDRRAS